MNEKSNTHHSVGTHPRDSRRSWRPWRRAAEPGEGWNLRFESAGTAVPAALVKDSPTLLVAAVEELCWRVATEGWRARRPHRWQRRAYAAWRGQADWLEQKRLRLADMVDDALALN